MTTALVMAGGRGERLRASGTSVPKPLVPIAGVPLLERNLLTLLSSGLRDIVVAVPSHTPEIAEFVGARCRPLADVFESRLRLFEERSPLGNIGAAAEVEPCDPELLIVYADNLTALDLNALVNHHRSTAADLTTAVHLEPFRIPYGEVRLQDGMVISYEEKPGREVLVSSGVFVLSPAASALLPRGRQSEVSWLVNRLLAEKMRVAAFLHTAPWIDVNDAAAVLRAEQLVAAHPEAFEPPEPATLMQSRGS
jgi:NDP-sugar pyrophosphorylase family protein